MHLHYPAKRYFPGEASPWCYHQIPKVRLCGSNDTEAWMTKPADDFEAVRQIVQVLENFEKIDDRERILRWAREKLGMPTQPGGPNPAGIRSSEPAAPLAKTQPPVPTTDIKNFIQSKDPKTDTQLVAVVAYYYRFVAPEAERKEQITVQDLLDACRTAGRNRPKAPPQTLVNAYNTGIMDKAGRGAYRINTVGENLVAMVLPGQPGELRPERGGKKPKNRKVSRNRKSK